MKNKENIPTILLVDDNEVNIDILLGVLNGYDLIAARSGKEALEIIKEDSVDLILLDIMMPCLDGFEVCKIIKSNQDYLDIPIIFLTAKNNSDDIKKGFECGAIDYITKPFNPTELNIRINTHIELVNYKKDLEKRVKEEVEANKLNQEILFQKAKQAEIGELMMHISHQWKQPLSELGSINTLMVGKLEYNQSVNIEEYHDNLKKNGKIISFMSQTMETFQNFYRPNQELQYFDIYEAIEIAINIVTATFDYNGIKLNITGDKDLYKVYGNINEYSQIILSILNNAKNIFIKREIQDPEVTIDIRSHKHHIVVTLIDNGGGIVYKENCEDIFSPFVSSSDSTGIGLYLVKAICKKNSWSIEGLNAKNGAKFILVSDVGNKDD